jgi:hypothetical protein
MACPNSVVASGVNLTTGGSGINLAVTNPAGCGIISPSAGATLSASVPGVVNFTAGTNGWSVFPATAGATVLTFGAPGLLSTAVNVAVTSPAPPPPVPVDVVSF